MTDNTCSSAASSIKESFALGDRQRSDACPGVRAMHEATDGYIGRMRFAGGHVTADQWRNLAQLATTFGDGDIHLTTRGNIQIRGISSADQTGFAEQVVHYAMSPSLAHDRMRNIICSPRTPWLHPLAHALDDALLATPATATLAGRTLFALDDGRGDMLHRTPDMAAIATTALVNADSWRDTEFRIVLGGNLTDYIATGEEIPQVITAVATRWAAIRDALWRIGEDTSGEKYQQLVEVVADHAATTTKAIGNDHQWANATDANTPSRENDIIDRFVGWHDEPDGTVTLGAGLPFGKLTATAAELLATAECTTTATCWHTVMLYGLDEAVAEAVVKAGSLHGLVFDRHSPRLSITACTGLPGCEKSLSDVRRDAITLMQQGDPGEYPVHFSGCQRRCGHPAGKYVDYLATSDGEYEVTEPAPQ
ncbi:precorrin-3B synthase [Corynebacterium choanae]|uniref:Ferredoxin-nitrite reductase n=1 Tax=Corynebacterium choanae TaxID=1862358 RepID=A0A3G6J6I3_9CORY|nr:precorrin-3B synthase [Corynebacterium choanae]AZA13549.1 ferredoxin-nitrite reductase [Corynebacterium choanae]